MRIPRHRLLEAVPFFRSAARSLLFLLFVANSEASSSYKTGATTSRNQGRRAQPTDSPNTEPRALDTIDILRQFSIGDEKLPERIATRQLGLAFAATHGPTKLITDVLYNLAARWDEYEEEIRREIEKVLAENKWLMSKATMSKMSKLDSFMKESQRLNPNRACKYLPYNAASSVSVYFRALIRLPTVSLVLSKAHGPLQTFKRTYYTKLYAHYGPSGADGNIIEVSRITRGIRWLATPPNAPRRKQSVFVRASPNVNQPWQHDVWAQEIRLSRPILCRRSEQNQVSADFAKL